ncbi:metal ABC transporter solute-binding protein, Zn/Mn family [Klebsiella pneumoniae]
MTPTVTLKNTTVCTSPGHFTVNPEIQPGAQRLHEIRTQLVEQKATCVFAEPQFRPAVIEAVARGTSVRMGTLRIHWGQELRWVKPTLPAIPHPTGESVFELPERRLTRK